MKIAFKYLISIACLLPLLFTTVVFASPETVDNQSNPDIVLNGNRNPVISLQSADPENTGRDFVDASKSNIATGFMYMASNDGTVIYDGALSQIKARGNSTFTYAPKKSYQIKLEKKTDLLETGEKVKTWVLLAGYNDATKIHDKTMKDFAASLGMPFVASSTWVNLYYDGVYRGLYLLSEKNSVSKTSVDISDMEEEYEAINEEYGADPVIRAGKNKFGFNFKYTADLADPEDLSGGYLLELNGNKIDEASGFYTRREKAINVKSPEWAGKEAMLYISEFYQEFEDAVYAVDSTGNFTGYNTETGKYYYDYVDRDSLVRLFLLKELSQNTDEFVYSTFLYKDKGSDKLVFGPIWDQEMVFGTGWNRTFSAAESTRPYLVNALLRIPDFRDAVMEYYQGTFRAQAESFLGEDGALINNVELIRDSVTADNELWPFVRFGNPSIKHHLWAEGTTYQDVVDDMMKWAETRLAHLNKLYGLVDSPGNAYYAVPIHWAMDLGITNGIDDTHFGPDLSCTRAQMVTFLWRAAGSPEVPSQSASQTAPPEGGAERCPFIDVSEDAYYYKAVLWAVEQGITTGTSETTFSPNATVTRGQSVTFLYRYDGQKTDAEIPFEDVEDGAYYEEAVQWAVSEEITNGTSETTFEPDSPCTRGQIVTFLYRDLAE